MSIQDKPTARRRGVRPNADQRRVVWIAAVLVPLAVLTVAAIGAFLQLPRLPERVATHWGPNGADQFGAPGGSIVTMIVVAIFTIAILATVGLVAGQASMTRKMVGAISVGLTVLVGVLVNGIFLLQQGMSVSGVAQVRIDSVAVVAVVAAVLSGVLVAWLIPADPPMPADQPIPKDAPTLGLGTGELVMWSQRMTMRGTLAIFAFAAVATVIVAFVMKEWLLLLVSLVLIVATVMSSSFRAQIDRHGLTCRGAIGVPKIHVPINEIESAEARQIDPLREFGGWGFRTGRDGATGFVFRQGEGLVVHRTGGRKVVATVNDAATAAALLNSLARRERA